MSTRAHTPAAAAALAVARLRRHYGETPAVDGVSFAAAAGEIVCLLGHSGCGKTTLLRLVAGLEAADDGEVRIGDETVSGPGCFVPAERRRVGLVFQDYALFPHLDATANVLFGLRSRSPAERNAAAQAALERVGLMAKARCYPHMLSGGEQQRVALARALATAPRLLLMDEPFSNLDRRLRDRIRDDTVALLRETGTTAVIVTHDPEEALRIADRIVLMHRGRVEQDAAPEILYRQPTSLFAARFFSALNELPGEVRGGSVETPFGRFAAQGIVDGPAVVGLRPQDIALAENGVGQAARVEDSLFLGDVLQLRLRIDGLDPLVTLRLSESPPLHRGQAVHLRVRRDAALIFPATSFS